MAATTKKLVLQNEADLWDAVGGNYTGAAQSASVAYTTFLSSGLTVPMGCVVNLKSLTITTDGPVYVTGRLTKGYYAGVNPKAVSTISLVFGAAGSQTLSYGDDGIDLFEGGNISLFWTSPTTTRPTVTVQPNALLFTNDWNLDASCVYAPLGDSGAWGTILGNVAAGSVANFGSSHYAYRLSDSMRTAGVPIRQSNRAFGGSGSLQLWQALQNGVFDKVIKDWNLVTIQEGTNDALNGDATSQAYSTNIQGSLDYIFLKNPGVSIILIAPPHSNTTGRVTNLPSYRTALVAIMALGKYAKYVDNNQLKYYDCTQGTYTIAAPAGTDTNYVETGAAAQIHLRGDTGHLLMYNGLWPVVQTTNFYLSSYKKG